MNSPPPLTAPLWRRLASVLYDSLLLVGVWFVATLPLLVIRSGEVLPVRHRGFQVYLLIIAGLYFAAFWRYAGQTAGMRAWRLQVVGRDAQSINWLQALARAVFGVISCAFLGAGFIWSLFTKERAAWHDTWSRTQLIVMPRDERG